MATAEAIARQNEEWAAQAKFEADMATKRAARLTNRGARRPAVNGWGSNGTRYDETCELCGEITEIDNGTGICRACSR